MFEDSVRKNGDRGGRVGRSTSFEEPRKQICFPGLRPLTATLNPGRREVDLAQFLAGRKVRSPKGTLIAGFWVEVEEGGKPWPKPKTAPGMAFLHRPPRYPPRSERCCSVTPSGGGYL